jgi:hypothetical protein
MKQRRVLRVAERAILGTMMTVVAFVVERKLLKALRKGGSDRLQPVPEIEIEQVAQVTTSRDEAPPEA